MKRGIWLALFALVAAGIFWLPYYVPASSSVVSDSLRFGFNNHIAVAAVIIGLAFAAALSVFSPLIRRDELPDMPPGQIGIRPLLFVCGIQTAIFIVIDWMAAGGPPVGEAAYFLPRLYFMSHGLAPYRDFEFAYGPALAYLPSWAHLRLGLSLESAFTLSAWLFGVAGYCILWLLLRQAHAGRRAKLAVFVCLATWFHIAPAPQYSLLRFLCVFGGLSLAAAATQRFQRRWYFLPPFFVALTAAVLTISPEMACVFIPGILIYLLLEFRFRRQFFRLAAIYLTLTACLASLIPSDMFLVFRGFAAGGNGFPVLPSPYMLFYLGTLFAVFPPLLVSGLEILRGGKPVVRPFGGPLTLAFVAVSVCLIPGALGRADLGHVYFYGIGVLLLGLLSNWSPVKWQMPYWAGVAVAFQGVGFVLLLHFMSSAYLSAAGQQTLHWVEQHPESVAVSYGRSFVGDARWDAFLTRTRHVRDLSLEHNYSALAGVGPICTPAGDAAAFFVLAHHDNLKPEYFYAFMNIFTPRQIQRKLDDARTCRYTVQRSGPADTSSVRDSSIRDEPSEAQSDANNLRAIAWNLSFPWLPRMSRTPDPYAAFWAGMKEFVPVKQVNERWFLWERRSDAYR
jgi:hypothetical protein